MSLKGLFGENLMKRLFTEEEELESKKSQPGLSLAAVCEDNGLADPLCFISVWKGIRVPR